MYLYLCDGGTGLPTARGLIANNFVSIGGNSTAYGIQLYNSTNLDVYYNSVNITSTNISSGRGLTVEGGNSSITVVNNVFANKGGGYAYYVGAVAAIGTSDYNDLYATGNFVGYWNGNRTTLTALQSASGKDANSVSVDPLFSTNTDLHIGTLGLDSAAIPISSVLDDIDGEIRDTVRPDIGADEFKIVIIPIFIGIEYMDTLKAFGTKFYRLQTSKGKTLSTKIQTTAMMRPPKVYLSLLRIFDQNNYQFRWEKISFSTNEIIIPNTVDGNYYFYVYNPKNKHNSYKLRVDSLGFSISRIRENIAGNNGEVTIEVIGARFMDSSNVLLRRTGFSDIIA